MGKKDFKINLLEIIKASERIEKYIEMIDSFTGFKKDRKTIDAVVRNFEIIGEAANRIPLELQQKNTDINWREIIAMRNILAHEYDEVEEEVIWNTIKKDLPGLKLQIQNIIDNYKE